MLKMNLNSLASSNMSSPALQRLRKRSAPTLSLDTVSTLSPSSTMERQSNKPQMYCNNSSTLKNIFLRTLWKKNFARISKLITWMDLSYATRMD